MNASFKAQATVSLPGAPAPLSFDRGWASIEVKFHDARFHFVNTHLEVEAPPEFAAVQEAQAARTPRRPDATRPGGDHSGRLQLGRRRQHHAHLPNTDHKGRFLDAWWTNLGDPGLTCCQNNILTNPLSELSTRIDLILTRWALPTEAHLVGDTPFQSVPPLWPSDHPGVVADVLMF